MQKEIIADQLAAYTKQIRRMAKDQRLLATHVSLFTAMFVQCQQNGYTRPFAVTRKGLMAFSKIASVATYHKCIKELDEFGYIKYEPSFNPKSGSLIYWPVTI
jgi:hypothetical protein